MPDPQAPGDLPDRFAGDLAQLLAPGAGAEVAATLQEAASTLDDAELARFVDALAEAIASGAAVDGLMLSRALARARAGRRS